MKINLLYICTLITILSVVSATAIQYTITNERTLTTQTPIIKTLNNKPVYIYNLRNLTDTKTTLSLTEPIPKIINIK